MPQRPLTASDRDPWGRGQWGKEPPSPARPVAYAHRPSAVLRPPSSIETRCLRNDPQAPREPGAEDPAQSMQRLRPQRPVATDPSEPPGSTHPAGPERTSLRSPPGPLPLPPARWGPPPAGGDTQRRQHLTPPLRRGIQRHFY